MAIPLPGSDINKDIIRSLRVAIMTSKHDLRETRLPYKSDDFGHDISRRIGLADDASSAGRPWSLTSDEVRILLSPARPTN